MPELVAASAPEPSRRWAGSTLVILAAIFFVLAGIEPQAAAYRQVQESLIHNWISMSLCAVALVFARRRAFGPLPSVLRGLSGVLLPLFIMFSILGLLVWPPLWEALRPLGVIESEARPVAIEGTFVLVFIGFGFLILRAVFRWLRRLRARYEQAGFAVGFGPVYFFFRRRRASQ